MFEGLCDNAQPKSIFPRRAMYPRRPYARSFGHTFAATTLRALLFLTLLLGLISNAALDAAPHAAPANPAGRAEVMVLATTAAEGN